MSSVSALSTRRNRHYRILSLLWVFLVLGGLLFYLVSGMVSIRRSDTSSLVVRWPIKLDRMNNAAPDIPPQELIETEVTAGVVRYVGATDGVDRIFAYNRVEDYPFYVLVGRAYDEQFTSWRIISSIAAAAALFMILLTVLLLRRMSRDTANLVGADARLRKALGDKEGLIRELLHRTNNSLQVTRSLVQLELIDTTPSKQGELSPDTVGRSHRRSFARATDAERGE